MDFYALLDQVMALLRQRQRVTYRALQRQFDLDEATLSDLKDELLYAHQQGRDEEPRAADRQSHGAAFREFPEPAPTRHASRITRD